jgi:hypothetical protein
MRRELTDQAPPEETNQAGESDVRSCGSV